MAWVEASFSHFLLKSVKRVILMRAETSSLPGCNRMNDRIDEGSIPTYSPM